MRFDPGLRWATVTMALMLVGGMGRAAQKGLPTPEEFFRDPVFASPTLSPDGRHVAMLVSSKGTRHQLAVLDLETLKPRALAGDPERDVASFSWVNGQRLVYTFRTKLVGHNLVEERPGLFAVSLQGDRRRMLVQTKGERFVTMGETDTRTLDTFHEMLPMAGAVQGDDVYVARAGEVSREKVDYIDIKRLNTFSGQAQDVQLPKHAKGWVFGHDFQPLAVRTELNGQASW
jgi:hypothetical protein